MGTGEKQTRCRDGPARSEPLSSRFMPAEASGTSSIAVKDAPERRRLIVAEGQSAQDVIRPNEDRAGGRPFGRSPAERVVARWWQRVTDAWSPCHAWLGRRWLWVVIGLVICLCWDRAVYLNLADAAALGDPAAMEVAEKALEQQAWYIGLRLLGDLTWIVLILLPVLGLRDWAHFAAQHTASPGRIFRRGVFVLLSAALAGGAAEVLKLVVRRLRPDSALDASNVGGWFMFRAPWDRPLVAENLGFASSHTAVAFGAAFALGFVWPRWRWAFLLLATGTAITRLLVGAHFLSDAFAGAVLGLLAVLFVRELDRLNNSGLPVENHLSTNHHTLAGSLAA